MRLTAIIAVSSKCHRQKVFYFLMNGLNNLPDTKQSDKESEIHFTAILPLRNMLKSAPQLSFAFGFLRLFLPMASTLR